jgi:hypothetical protein
LFDIFFDHFGGHFGTQKLFQKGTKNGTTFGTLSSRLNEVHMKRFWELNESGEIPIAIGIILPQRQGGI